MTTVGEKRSAVLNAAVQSINYEVILMVAEYACWICKRSKRDFEKLKKEGYLSEFDDKEKERFDEYNFDIGSEILCNGLITDEKEKKVFSPQVCYYCQQIIICLSYWGNESTISDDIREEIHNVEEEKIEKLIEERGGRR